MNLPSPNAAAVVWQEYMRGLTNRQLVETWSMGAENGDDALMHLAVMQLGYRALSTLIREIAQERREMEKHICAE